MHITQLEIDNFKSFGKKTKIPFFEGFTVISGPNGSGKSNIIDSVLFCLGLASSRGLRAEKLTDLINLNSGRNTAEVAIQFSDGSSVRRRIRRTASGYYSYHYLNDRLCKQSDVTEFLARIGIKPEGYNVVMQGDITRIMEMSDLERRKILDEIAGVAEFDAKRDQAISELEVVRERIEREELLLRELTDRLADLERERERAIEYRSLQDQLRHYESCRGAARLREKTQELGTIGALLAEQSKALGEAERWRDTKESELADQRGRLQQIDEQIQEKSGQEYLALLERLEGAKSAIKLGEQTTARLAEEKVRNQEALDRTYLDSKRAEARVKECTEAIRNLGIDRANLAMELATLRAQAEKCAEEMDRSTKEQEDARDQLFRWMEEIEQQKSRRADLLHEQDALIERSRLRTSESERLTARLRQIASEIEEKERQIQEAVRVLAECAAQKERIERDISASERALFGQRASQERLRKEIKAREQDLMRLEAQAQARGEGENRAIEAVLGMEGVHGTIAQLGRAPPEYALALDVAAGGRLSNVVVDDDEVAASAIRFLKESKLGRVTFLPLSKLKAVPLPPLQERGAIDYAVNLLEYDKRYDPAFRLVFGATVVMDTLDHARARIGKYRMVTLEGELLERSGSMSGGYYKQRRGFGVAVDEEMNRLRAALAASSQELLECEQAISRLTAEVEDGRTKRTAVDEQIARHRILEEEYRRIAAALRREEEELGTAIRTLDSERSGGPGRLAEIEGVLEGIGAAIARLTADIDALKAKLDDTHLPELVERLEKLKKSIEEMERRLRNKDSDIADMQRERQYFAKRMEELNADRERLQERNRAIEGEIAAIAAEIASHRSGIRDLEERQRSFSRELDDLRRIRDETLHAIHACEQEIAEQNAAMERTRIQIAALRERERTAEAEAEMLRMQCGEVATDLSLAEITEAIRKTEQAIQAIGAVNMLAVEEYDRISARIDERSEKKEVLSRERTMLMERIEKFERLKFDAFMTAYRAIDANFREIFARLTSGSGHLVLENEEDPFAGGLTFAVQPRDKKVHLLSALSGGEKSLTTLAFIFSIQKYMPAPFYALDEVDMFLDGSNVERIASMLKELSAHAQSVVVSLRKPMIEHAERIVGVTLNPDKSTLVTGIRHG
ncbi:MAG: chromosome segregation protein SMC [Methanomicrobiales archaeon]|nr:chromosome segregation protein SMC [Methanomicrobiales archaeon]MDI6875391.1 chromosome segregation protein SMC [Methanomicrobiales archaeon]